jgi:glycosyltransferase involved in cell wall biosynthesis
MKILLIHTKYQSRGGEDAVFEQEHTLLKEDYNVEKLLFYNRGRIRGAIQFLFSIWNIFSALKVKKKIKEFQPDIVHIHNWHYASGPLIIRAVKKKKIPLVITLHNYRLICPSATLLYNNKVFNNSLCANFPWKAIKNRVYRNSYFQTFWLAVINWIHRKIGTWNKVDKYIVLTEFARNLFISSSLNVSDNKFVVKQNFSESNTKETLTQRNNEFLFIGRLSDEKGIGCLLDVFKKVDYIIHIGGDGPFKQKVINAAPIYPNIRYIGNLNKTEVLENMKKCSILLFPSIWYEGMPMTLIEAFSVGTPVIASNLGAMSSMIKNNYNGLLFEADNSDALAKVLNVWINKSESEKNVIYENAYQSYLDNYTKEKNKKLLEDIYKQAINQASHV